MTKYTLTLFSIIMILLSACSDAAEDRAKDISTEEESSIDVPEGVQLELVNVGDAARDVFESYFSHIEQAHEDMIYRKTERTQELFTEDREDLKNATLIYDANQHHFTYVFYYDPRPSDLLIAPDQPMMIIDIATYFYIQNTISDYFLQIRLDLQEQNIHLDHHASVSFLFQTAQEGSYMHVETMGGEALVTVKNEGDPVEYAIPGGFASSPIKVSVKNSMQFVQGENSDEMALLKFFGVPDEAFTDQNASDDPDPQEEEEESSAPNDKTAMDDQASMEATDALQYSLEEYGMTLTFPESWKGRYAVTEGDWMERAIESYDFTLMDNDQPVGNIFSLIVTDMSEQSFKDYYEGSFVTFIQEVDGMSIGYSMPGEPPTELLEAGNEELLEEYSRMVNVDLPEIINRSQVQKPF